MLFSSKSKLRPGSWFRYYMAHTHTHTHTLSLSLSLSLSSCMRLSVCLCVFFSHHSFCYDCQTDIVCVGAHVCVRMHAGLAGWNLRLALCFIPSFFRSLSHLLVYLGFSLIGQTKTDTERHEHLFTEEINPNPNTNTGADTETVFHRDREVCASCDWVCERRKRERERERGRAE